MNPDRFGDLEIEVDAPFTRGMWRIQRIGWVALSALVVAGALGAFGGGLLAQRTIEAGDGALRVEYERFVRRHAPTRLEIRARASGEGRLVVWIDREYLERFEVRAISPEPIAQRTGDERCELELDLTGRSGEGVVVLDLEPREPGALAGRIGCGRAEARIEQWAYP